MVDLLLNSTVSIAVIAYFMYRDNKFMSKLDTTLQTLVDTISCVHDLLKGERKGEE